jgi:diguanylate cyclase (GGDEF)-like protein/PAS domain S-box-containing protein
MLFSKWKLYQLVAIFTTITIVFAMSLYSWHLYTERKNRLVERLEADSRLTLRSLQKNLSHFIESYAIEEYQHLIESEMHHIDFKAIVIEDFNAAAVIGKKHFFTGWVKTRDGKITPYDSKRHPHLLDRCRYVNTLPIFSSSHSEIGKITICSAQDRINKELQTLLTQNIVVSALFGLTLSIILYFILRQFALLPITHIIQTLTHRDKYGLPEKKVQEFGAYEFELLSQTINLMIETIQASRLREEEAMEALESERQRFKLAIDGSQDGLWDWNTKTNKVLFSHRWKEMLGYSDEEVSDSLDEWSKRVHPDDIEAAMKAINEHLAGKTEVYENRHRVQCKDGSWKWILDRGKALFNDDGKPIRVVGFHTDVTKEIKHQEALEHSAKHDVLTKLPNRFLFNELIQTLIHRSDRNKKTMAILYLDLDGFKDVNDTYGHEAGDYVLVEVSKRMKNLLRQEDVIARLGGDEFVIALSDISDKQNITPLLDRLLERISLPILYTNKQIELKVSVSIGITTYPQESSMGPEALLRQADQAMYQAKNSGKNQYRFFNFQKGVFNA